MSAIELAGPVLAGDDDVRERAWIVGGRVTYDRPSSVGDRVEGFAVPGFVDMHCHLAVGPSGPVEGDLVVKHARVEAEAGVLLARDTGSASSLDVLDGHEGLPVVHRSGRFIARPKRYLRDYAVEIAPDELPAEAARQARASRSWVKIIADWIDRDLGDAADLAPLWEPAQLSAAVAAAHAEGARVTAHTFATESLDALLDAGLDSIEHGTGMTHEHMRRAADAGIPVIPTMLQVSNFEAFAAQGRERFPLFAARMQRMYDRRFDHLRDMYDAGVTLLVGTDAGTSVAHGDLAREAAQMARVMPAAQVLAAATWRARQFLAAPVLDEGDPADVVILADDPRADIGALADPAAVFRAGVRLA